MAYSKKPRVLTTKYKPQTWPQAWWDPATGEERVFFAREQVPYGWTDTKPVFVEPKKGVELDRDELVAKLTEMGVEISLTWGNAHMKRIIEGDVSPTG